MLIRKTIPIASIIVVGLSMLLVGCFAAVPASPELEILFGAVSLAMPVGVAAWWLFRTHATSAPREVAQTLAVTFATCASLAYLLAIPIATMLGGYSSGLSPSLGLVGALVTVWALMSVICFAGCSLALRRRDSR